MTEEEIQNRRDKARMKRYKKPIVNHMNLQYIKDRLEEIQEACDEVRWFEETEDDSLIDELIGGEEEAYEFKLMFFTLGVDCDQMIEDLYETWIPEIFDIFFVAVGGGDEYDGLLGYDSFDGDYFGLENDTVEEWAVEESLKKLMSMTKKELVESARKCFRIYSSYVSLANRYEDLKASIDIIRGKNAGHLRIVTQINQLYEEAEETRFENWDGKAERFKRLVESLPQEVWL